MKEPITYTEARKIVNEYQTKIREQEDKQLAQEAKALVGKCFRYRNSYGSGESWWYYVEVIGSKENQLITETFQETPIEIEIKRRHHYFPLDADYGEISRKEFQKAKNAIIAKMNMKQK